MTRKGRGGMLRSSEERQMRERRMEIPDVANSETEYKQKMGEGQKDEQEREMQTHLKLKRKARGEKKEEK